MIQLLTPLVSFIDLIACTMKYLAAFTSLLAAASAAATAQRSVDYTDHKVIRVAYTDEIKEWIAKNSLSTWVKQNGNVDVVVRPNVAIPEDVKVTVMHENLGQSIKEEGQFQPYDGKTITARDILLLIFP